MGFSNKKSDVNCLPMIWTLGGENCQAGTWNIQNKNLSVKLYPKCCWACSGRRQLSLPGARGISQSPLCHCGLSVHCLAKYLHCFGGVTVLRSHKHLPEWNLEGRNHL